jgi:hypothetical protein
LRKRRQRQGKRRGQGQQGAEALRHGHRINVSELDLSDGVWFECERKWRISRKPAAILGSGMFMGVK